MSKSKRTFSTLLLIVGMSLACTPEAARSGDVASQKAPAPPAAPSIPAPPPPDMQVPYVPTPPAVVDAMLDIAKVTGNDVVYDLGCGDGRIVIAAAKKFGASGVGVDIDPDRIEEANENAKAAGVTHLVKFVEQDLFETDIREATVLTLYLLPDVNMKLRPTILRDLKPGSRVVSNSFDMGDWKPDAITEAEGKTIYFWTVPERGKMPTR